MINGMISIIVPVYNVEAYLSRCIDSIIVQSYACMEIILINDGSTDRSSIICDEYAFNDNRIKVIHKANGGVSKARNAGLDVACGEWIGFVDSDDTVDSRMYEKLLNLCLDNNLKLASCGYQRIKSNGSKHNFVNVKLPKLMTIEQCIKNKKIFIDFGNICSMLYHNSFFYGNGGVRFDEDVHVSEDTLFVVRTMLLYEGSIGYIPEPLYKYYQREGSATISGINKKSISVITAYNRQVSLIESKYPEAVELHIRGFIANMLGFIYFAYKGGKKEKSYIYMLKKNIREAAFKLIKRNGSLTIKILCLATLISPKLASIAHNKRSLKREASNKRNCSNI